MRSTVRNMRLTAQLLAAPEPRHPSTERGAQTSLRTGALINGRYEIDDVLGVGGMGVVYRARDRQHPDRVAIMYGPVVLAQDEACCRRPFSLAPHTSLMSRLRKEDRDLRFRILNAMPERHTRYLVPLYSLPPFRPYWVYFDLHALALY